MIQPITITTTDEATVLKVIGVFGLQRAHELRDLYGNISTKEVILDFAECTRIDSSGLGLLLNLRKNLPPDINIKLVECPQHMQKILTITRFERFFDIE